MTITVKAYGARAGDKPLEPMTIPRREMGARDVVIDIRFCGVCHSDLYVAADMSGRGLFPVVPGHEIVGEVERVGSNVSRFRPGDRVGVGCMVDSCGSCEMCAAGEEQYCLKMVGTYGGKGRDGQVTQGGYSACITVDQKFVLSIPDSISLEEAAPLLCAGITTYGPLRRFGVTSGTRVGIVGLGGLGHVAVKLAVAMGATVTVISSSDRKRADAIAMGAHDFVAIGDPQQRAAFTGALDLILNTVSAPSDIDWLVSRLAVGGEMVMVGITGAATIQMLPLLFRRRSISGSLIGGIRETQEMLDFAAEHGIVPDIELLPVDAVNTAWERLEKGDVRFRFVLDTATLDPERAAAA
jgi:uncharacterized zinc-type alcohol dehydrogenase-like protein